MPVTLDLSPADINALMSAVRTSYSFLLQYPQADDSCRTEVNRCGELLRKLGDAHKTATDQPGHDALCAAAANVTFEHVTPASTLISAIRAAGKIPRSYSGRGMFGAECVACSVPRGEDFAGLPAGYTTDSLGLGTIAYWKRVAWPEGAEDES